MADIQDHAKATDDISITLEGVENQPDRKAYKVVSKAGLFKNGKQIDEGEEVQLDEQSAKNFLRNGDIEEL